MALAGGLAGAAAGIVAVAAWLTLSGDLGLFAAVQAVAAAGLAAPHSWAILLLAAAGFLLVGSLVRNRLVTSLLSRGLLVGTGTALGILAATGVYVGIAMSSGFTLAKALALVGPQGTPRYLMFVLVGALAGLAASLALAGRKAVGAGLRTLAGACVGLTAALVIYAIAYVVVFYPEIPHSTEWVLRFGEAIGAGAQSEFVMAGIGAVTGAMLARYSWRLYGVLTFLSLLFVVLGYILYTLSDTLPNVPDSDKALSRILFGIELTSLLMVLLYSFYTIDVAARKHWRRTTEEAPFSPYFLPKVALQVPTFNEPFSLVRQTLECLVKLDYPRDRFVIMVADDSTQAESSQPLKAYCEERGILYHHRVDRRGYKAGALNSLLAITPRDVNIIAVIDADYQVEPDYLKETVGYFIDPAVGWLQTPQDYRNRHQSFLTEQYYLADAYFYRTILPSRNEENSIIFCGTMGMLRKRALIEVGGWNEACITEDAELSVRLLNAGWGSLYVNKTYGRGLIPPTFEAYKKQHYRWAFGGGRILRTHGWRFLFGRFTFRQRLDYVVGTMSWLEGAFIFAISCFVLAMGIGDLMGVAFFTHHANEVLLVGLVPLFLLLDGLTRVHLVLSRSVNLGFGGTVRILGMWSSVKFSNMRAALKALVGFSIPFVRTPKAPEDRMSRGKAARHAVRLTTFESTMAAFLILTCLGVMLRMGAGGPDAMVMPRMFLIFWLLYYSVIFLAAPIYAYKSFSTLRSEADAALIPQEVTT